ncbi:glycosyltransferase family 1 protein [Komagataeibacter rhaeticus]|uniref:glycosyltransferase family 4 protein n=1 Tax=Komagataeibacter rhaeticus TaxID=215221 RepID=UPI0004D6B683|nr:glycosyltransferase family 1 protein [Komagataeibacter rhaeticus]KDU96346.1 glycosyl transferase family 1 [Komagataeibacter rhaeticus AF1]MBL7240753.1 glycosyltransferase family 4 protein [Komagataeibacter rhaeticus]PYD53548.1 glycosyltransferase family 1 protein [Komagataeibacter rhaeticus]GBQ15472.1 glycosyltransferase [Komagataeibacter rhaeticus DSM 16663]
MSVHIFMDLSRLIARAGVPVPTGIDRVEYEYARHLLEHEAHRTHFVAFHPVGRIGEIPFEEARDFVGRTGRAWDGARELCSSLRWQGRRLTWQALKAADRGQGVSSPAMYLNVSHHHLTRPRSIGNFLVRYNALFIAMVHDLIPMEFPEYGRPGEAEKHLVRMRTVARLGAGAIVPSHAVGRSLAPYLRHSPAREHVAVVPHGVHLGETVPEKGAFQKDLMQKGRPYFVCLGTIEPRKNHLLLLHIWRSMAEEMGAQVPHLVVVGKRGWENENVVDMLERCPALRGCVHECQGLTDPEVAALLQDCAALVFPSFSEGFGLPLAEALVLGVPVICSDIPVFHEFAGSDVTYIDPTDGPAWMRAIRDASRGKAPATASGGSDFRAPDLFQWPEQVGKGIQAADSIIEKYRRNGLIPA